jgi:hypothetical protein
MDENEPLEWHERLFLQVVVLYMAVVVGAIPAFLIIMLLNFLRLLVAPEV